VGECIHSGRVGAASRHEGLSHAGVKRSKNAVTPDCLGRKGKKLFKNGAQGKKKITKKKAKQGRERGRRGAN